VEHARLVAEHTRLCAEVREREANLDAIAQSDDEGASPMAWLQHRAYEYEQWQVTRMVQQRDEAANALKWAEADLPAQETAAEAALQRFEAEDARMMCQELAQSRQALEKRTPYAEMLAARALLAGLRQPAERSVGP